tara:strand:- start:276 stop:491 length:216 start_codon:yes stop_codon:yes gene_type:complete
MNFILTLIICSFTTGTCLPPNKFPEKYHDGYSCMIDGNQKSIDYFVKMGAEVINKHKIYIKFYCLEEGIKS